MTRSIADRRAAFRALHDNGCFVLPNPWDVGSARMMQHLGFKAIASTSAGFAWSTGRADNKVTCDDVVGHLAGLCAAVDLPVNADFEGGFADQPEGVAANVTRAVDAGVAGLSIEDSTGDNKEPLYEEGLAIERIVAARTAIQETGVPFVLTARCEAFLFDVEQPFKFALERLRKFVEAGADVIYAPGITDAHEIATLVREGGAAVNVLGGVGRHPLGLVELESLGVKRVSIGPQLIRAALGGFMRAAAEIRDKGTFSFVSTNATSADINPFLASSADRKS